MMPRPAPPGRKPAGPARPVRALPRSGPRPRRWSLDRTPLSRRPGPDPSLRLLSRLCLSVLAVSASLCLCLPLSSPLLSPRLPLSPSLLFRFCALMSLSRLFCPVSSGVLVQAVKRISKEKKALKKNIVFFTGGGGPARHEITRTSTQGGKGGSLAAESVVSVAPHRCPSRPPAVPEMPRPAPPRLPLPNTCGPKRKCAVCGRKVFRRRTTRKHNKTRKNVSGSIIYLHLKNTKTSQGRPPPPTLPYPPHLTRRGVKVGRRRVCGRVLAKNGGRLTLRHSPLPRSSLTTSFWGQASDTFDQDAARALSQATPTLSPSSYVPQFPVRFLTVLPFDPPVVHLLCDSIPVPSRLSAQSVVLHGPGPLDPSGPPRHFSALRPS